jgi:hypothetical protein
MRKNYFLMSIVMLVLTFGFTVNAQVCSPNTSFTQPGIYPDTLPTGTVSQPYSEFITFVMPLDTQGIDFINFQIVSVALPVGLSWECNNASSSCNYNPQVNQYGCVAVTGTPLLAGIYNVQVTAVADLEIVSGVPVTFDVYMEILPAEVNTSNDGFSMSGFSGCSPVTVEFTNNNPGLLAYSWVFGNGNISTAENPTPQVYNQVGEHIVEYKAWSNLDTVEVYTLSNVRINSMSGYGEGFPSFETADAYYKIFEDGVLFAQSAFYLDVEPPVEWTTSNILDPTKTYTIEIWEADESASEVLFGADDLIGSHTMQLAGCSGCAAGTANINYTINYQAILPTPSVISVDTVIVYGYPGVPNIVYDETANIVSTDSTAYPIQWYFNGSPLANETGSSHVVEATGYYSLVSINGAGCVSFSDSVYAVFCEPGATTTLSESAGVLSVNNPNGYDVQWFLGGTAISGAQGDSYTPTGAGVYSAVLTTMDGCIIESNTFTSTLSLSSIENDLHLNVFPNPSNGSFTVSFENAQKIEKLEILDLTGRVVYSQFMDGNDTYHISLDAGAGSYMLRLSGTDVQVQSRISIQ